MFVPSNVTEFERRVKIDNTFQMEVYALGQLVPNNLMLPNLSSTNFETLPKTFQLAPLCIGIPLQHELYFQKRRLQYTIETHWDVPIVVHNKEITRNLLIRPKDCSILLRAVTRNCILVSVKDARYITNQLHSIIL
jgi:hypothetical protein